MKSRSRSLLSWAFVSILTLAGEVWAEVPWHDIPESLASAQPTRQGPEATGDVEASRESKPGGALGEDAVGFAWGIGRTALALVVVCGLLYLFLRFVLHRLSAPRGHVEDRFRIVDKFGLEPKRTLYIMEICGRTLLLSSGEAGIRFLTYLDERTSGGRVQGTGPAGHGSSAVDGGSFYQILQRKLDRPAFERESSEAEPIAPGSSRGEV